MAVCVRTMCGCVCMYMGVCVGGVPAGVRMCMWVCHTSMCVCTHLGVWANTHVSTWG